MPKNNFKLFDENKSNMMSDDDYAINQQRLNGVQSGVASSQLQNKTLYQTALMCYALAQLMAANGYDANDANAVSTFVNNLSSTMVQKVKDRASELEVKTGANVNKYITPGDFMTSLNYLTKAKYGESDPTTSTEGTLGQIYVNTTTQAPFYCAAISGNTFTWIRLARAKKRLVTEIITSSVLWYVPAGVSTVNLRMFGGGGGGSRGAGGGGGHMYSGVIDVSGKSEVRITVGAGGAVTSDASGVASNGGTTYFGNLASAAGGNGGDGGGHGGNGGTGGGGSGRNVGGDGSYGGGGGAGNSYAADGGNGGTYGGGGGGGGSSKGAGGKGGTGGTYGGNGGKGGGTNSASSSGSNGTNTIGMGLEFEGAGTGGETQSSGYSGGGGGGGGYGGNGGKGGAAGSSSAYAGGGGGGGYGAAGGDGSTHGGGGGGGYGGVGKNSPSNGGGGGGGYGANNYGAGGSAAEKGTDGVVIISYERIEAY